LSFAKYFLAVPDKILRIKHWGMCENKDSPNTTPRLALIHRTSSVYPITDLRKDGPLGWRCDYVTPYQSRCFHSYIWSSNTRQTSL